MAEFIAAALALRCEHGQPEWNPKPGGGIARAHCRDCLLATIAEMQVKLDKCKQRLRDAQA